MTFDIGFISILVFLEMFFFRNAQFNKNIKDFFWLIANFFALSFLVTATVDYLLKIWPATSKMALLDLSSSSIGFQILALLIVKDFLSYFVHRGFHHFSFFWKIHSVHHSIERIHSLSSFRHSIWEAATHVAISFLISKVLICNSVAVQFVAHSFLYICLWQHCNIDFSAVPLLNYLRRFLELLVVTPRLHRIHHLNQGLKIRHHNLGFLFSFWDRLFKTYRNDSPEFEKYGIEEENYPRDSLVRQWLYPLY